MSVGMILWKKLGGGLAVMAAASGWMFGEEPQPSEDRLKTSPVLRHLVPNPAGGAAVGHAGQETVGRMHVTEGFWVEVVAADKMVRLEHNRLLVEMAPVVPMVPVVAVSIPTAEKIVTVLPLTSKDLVFSAVV